MTEIEQRRRTHEWEDPHEMAASIQGLSGMEFFETWREGDRVPPIAATLGFTVEDFGEGRAEVSCEPAEYHYNPIGTVHGGLAATLLDTATGCAVHTRLPSGTGYTTINLNVSYMRPITTETGTVRAIADVVSLGSRVGVAEARLLDGRERVLARATSTCLILRPNS